MSDPGGFKCICGCPYGAHDTHLPNPCHKCDGSDGERACMKFIAFRELADRERDYVFMMAFMAFLPEDNGLPPEYPKITCKVLRPSELEEAKRLLKAYSDKVEEDIKLRGPIK